VTLVASRTNSSALRCPFRSIGAAAHIRVKGSVDGWCAEMAQENIVICSCGQWNRITARAKRGRFLCGKCGRRLEVSDRATRPGRRRTRWGMLAIAFLGITTIIVVNKLTNRISPGLNFRNAKPVQVSLVSTSALPQPDLGQSAPAPQARQAELAPVPVQNSVLRRRRGQSAVAGLKVTTPSSADYVLKLINTRDGKEGVLKNSAHPSWQATTPNFGR